MKKSWSEDNDRNKTLELLGDTDIPDFTRDVLKIDPTSQDLYFLTLAASDNDSVVNH